MWLVLALQLWMSFGEVNRNIVLSGSWQSCKEEDGKYAERIFDYCVLGKCYLSIHLGPYDEFGIYKKAESPEEENHAHSSSSNLLSQGGYRVSDYPTWRGKRNWTLPAAKLGLPHKEGLWVSVVQAEGSKEECQSYVIKIELKK